MQKALLILITVEANMRLKKHAHGLPFLNELTALGLKESFLHPHAIIYILYLAFSKPGVRFPFNEVALLEKLTN